MFVEKGKSLMVMFVEKGKSLMVIMFVEKGKSDGEGMKEPA